MLSSKPRLGGKLVCLVFTASFGLFSGLPAQSIAPVVIEHPIRPSVVETTTVYSCNMQPRSFSMIYRTASKAMMRAATYDGKAMSKSALADVNRYLERLDAVAVVEPECHSSGDILLVVGYQGKQRMMQPVYWSSTGFTAPAPFEIN